MIFKQVWCTIIVTSFRVQVLCLCAVNLRDVLFLGDNYKLAGSDSLPNYCFVRINSLPGFEMLWLCRSPTSSKFLLYIYMLHNFVCPLPSIGKRCLSPMSTYTGFNKWVNLYVCVSISYHICCRICAKCNIRTDQFCRHFPIFSVAWDWVQISSLLRSPLLAFSLALIITI